MIALYCVPLDSTGEVNEKAQDEREKTGSSYCSPSPRFSLGIVGDNIIGRVPTSTSVSCKRVVVDIVMGRV